MHFQQWRDCSPSPSLQSQFITLPLPILAPQKDALRGSRVADDDELKHSVREELRHFGEECSATGTQRMTQMWENCADNEGVLNEDNDKNAQS